MELNVSVHTDLIMLEGSTTLFTRLEFAMKFFMFFNRCQWDSFETVRVIFTPNLCFLECLGKLWTAHWSMKLSRILSLFAFTALTSPLLPLDDAGLAVNGVFAQCAVARDIIFRHYDLLANDTDNQFIQAKAFEVLAIAYSVLCHEFWSSQILKCSFFHCNQLTFVLLVKCYCQILEI